MKFYNDFAQLDDPETVVFKRKDGAGNILTKTYGVGGVGEIVRENAGTFVFEENAGASGVVLWEWRGTSPTVLTKPNATEQGKYEVRNTNF